MCCMGKYLLVTQRNWDEPTPVIVVVCALNKKLRSNVSLSLLYCSNLKITLLVFCNQATTPSYVTKTIDCAPNEWIMAYCLIMMDICKQNDHRFLHKTLVKYLF